MFEIFLVAFVLAFLAFCIWHRTITYPRVRTQQQLIANDVRVGDLVPVAGGSRRAPGDICNLMYGHKAIVCFWYGELHYRILT